jgi:hypothetical protein
MVTWSGLQLQKWLRQATGLPRGTRSPPQIVRLFDETELAAAERQSASPIPILLLEYGVAVLSVGLGRIEC